MASSSIVVTPPINPACSVSISSSIKPGSKAGSATKVAAAAGRAQEGVHATPHVEQPERMDEHLAGNRTQTQRG